MIVLPPSSRVGVGRERGGCQRELPGLLALRGVGTVEPAIEGLDRQGDRGREFPRGRAAGAKHTRRRAGDHARAADDRV